jgi:hypothetical protein
MAPMANGSPRYPPKQNPIGTTEPVYMWRVLNTYPVTDLELNKILSLSGQVTARFSIACMLIALPIGFWLKDLFYTELIALLLLGALGYGVGGLIARRNRSSEWARIMSESKPVESIAATKPLITSAVQTNAQTMNQLAENE